MHNSIIYQGLYYIKKDKAMKLSESLFSESEIPEEELKEEKKN